MKHIPRHSLKFAILTVLPLLTVAAGNRTPPDSLVTGFSYESPICRSYDSILPEKHPGFTAGGTFSVDVGMIDPNTGQFDAFVSETGTYIITYFIPPTDSTAGKSSTFALILKDKGNVSLAGRHTILPGGSVQIQASGADSYTWSPASGLSCLYCANPLASPAQNTRYCVAAEENNCRDTACTDVIVTCFDEDRDLSVPNAFSPNGDGDNDEFCLRGWSDCNRHFAIEIYDRWGERVYTSRDPDFCWNGIYRGQPLNAEVYVYLITATFTDNSIVNRQGNITLLR